MLSLAWEERKKSMYRCSFMEWTKKLHLFGALISKNGAGASSQEEARGKRGGAFLPAETLMALCSR